MDNPLNLDLIEWLLNYELDPPARRDVADEIKRLTGENADAYTRGAEFMREAILAAIASFGKIAGVDRLDMECLTGDINALAIPEDH
jgi:hypothetical protein